MAKGGLMFSESISLCLRKECSEKALTSLFNAVGWQRLPDAMDGESIDQFQVISWEGPNFGDEAEHFLSDEGVNILQLRGDAHSLRVELWQQQLVPDTAYLQELIKQGGEAAEQAKAIILSAQEIDWLNLLPTGPNNDAEAFLDYWETCSTEDQNQMLRLLSAKEWQRDALEDILASVLRFPDADFEPKLTASVIAARNGFSGLAPLVAQMELPKTFDDGVDKIDAEIIANLRQAVLRCLSGESLPDSPPEDERDARWWRLTAAVYGRDIAVDDRVNVLVHSLTTAHPPQPRSPFTPLPPNGVEYHGEGWRIAGTDIELAMIPAVPHLVGHEDRNGNSIRSVQAEKPFYIMRQPLLNEDEELMMLTAEEEQQLRKELIAVSGADIQLPSSEMLEMALRGCDGRRFFHGNIAERSSVFCSPWGIIHHDDIAEHIASNSPKSTWPVMVDTERRAGEKRAVRWMI